MVKNTVTKMVMVKFVDGEIKGARDATLSDIKRAFAECSDKELDELFDALQDEFWRRDAREIEASACATEAEEEIALDAMHD